METIHIQDLRRLLKEKGPGDPDQFLQIRFDDPNDDGTPALDEEFANKVLTVNSVHGLVTIVFNERGYLRSIDVS
ncbi:hypothetical protein AB1L88_26825 [Tautonia sp. JC769]|uniref:hypothetical protein n=1 Tax=Tautonia sp. JC769 TaxID=3232135 RepID=UPI003458A08C